MNKFGKNITISLFGESHGSIIGITIDHLPAGLTLPIEKINETLALRQGKPSISTPRHEENTYTIASGYYEGKTTGTPLTFLIYNNDIDSQSYEKGLIRPSQSDYPLFIKYQGFNDERGGGHSSGRLTAPLVILGAIAEEILEQKGIYIGSHIYTLKDLQDELIDIQKITKEMIIDLQKNPFPTFNSNIRKQMIENIEDVKNQHDSLGGIVETFIFGIKPGVGEPFFDSIESYIAHLIFAIPGIKGIEFGKGFAMTKYCGSQINDCLQFVDKKVQFSSNNDGGINAGISNGNLIYFRSAVRPTSTISQTQKSINIKTKENIIINNTGRHDPTFIHRALVVINALTAYAILDLLIESE